jgi:hypothetical protein
MSISRSHESAIVVTPATLKHQIITRINTLVKKAGGSYYQYDEQNMPKSLASIEGNDVYGIETNGRDVYLMTTLENDPGNTGGDFVPYNANEFFIEQLWDIYVACEPIYTTKFHDYGVMNEL